MAIVSNVHVYAALMDHAADLFRQADAVLMRLVLMLNDRAATLLNLQQQLHGVGTLQGQPEVTVFVWQRVGQGGSHGVFGFAVFRGEDAVEYLFSLRSLQ
jgi:hypothetical protein